MPRSRELYKRIKGPRPCKRCSKIVDRTWWGFCGSCKNLHYRKQSPERKKKHDAYNRAWNKRNPDRLKINKAKYLAKPGKREHRRDYLRSSAYGITKEQYWQMNNDQEGRCFICKLPERRRFKGRITNLVVDHNHETGKIRALLCHACNASLGFLDEDPDRIQRMVDYVLKFNRRVIEREGGAQ